MLQKIGLSDEQVAALDFHVYLRPNQLQAGQFN
jgi:hypothetical protein